MWVTSATLASPGAGRQTGHGSGGTSARCSVTSATLASPRAGRQTGHGSGGTSALCSVTSATLASPRAGRQTGHGSGGPASASALVSRSGQREDLGTLARDQQRVLELRADSPVPRHYRPAVVPHVPLVGAQVQP